jgi:TRAP-type C4-dicarboxylate transport system permease small subunit
VSEKVEAMKRIFVCLMILVVAGIFIWYGWGMIEFGWFQTSEIAELPMNWIYSAWPIAGILMALFAAEKIAKDVSILRDGNL